jgi:hypothetical protein
MATWTSAAYRARLQHEMKHATNGKAIDRLRTTLKQVEAFLTDTERDADVEGWCALLKQYESAATAAGRRFG